jgi:hypothetical protein
MCFSRSEAKALPTKMARVHWKRRPCMSYTRTAWSTTLVHRIDTLLRDDYDWAIEFKISFGVVGVYNTIYAVLLNKNLSKRFVIIKCHHLEGQAME